MEARKPLRSFAMDRTSRAQLYAGAAVVALDSTQAVFSGSGAERDGGKYKAYYPEAFYNGGSLRLPAVQEYEAPVTLSGQTYPKISHLPMYAESENTDLEFQNLCTVLNVRLMSSVNPVGSVPPLWDPTQYTLYRDGDDDYKDGYNDGTNRTPFQGIHAMDYASIPDAWKAVQGTPDA